VNTTETTTETIHGDTAIVAPSASNGFNSVQAAIDAGKRHVMLAEDISENNIAIPTVPLESGFRLESLGRRRVISDPDQNGTPILTVADTSTNSLNVTIRNIYLQGGAGTGPALDANFRAGGGTAHRWVLERINAKNTGPVILLSADEPHIRDLGVQTSTTATVSVNGNNVTVGAGLFLSGKNIDIRGGDISNGSGAGEFGMRLFACSQGTIYGGTNANHTSSTGTAAFGFDTCNDLTMHNLAVDGPGTASGIDAVFNSDLGAVVNHGNITMHEFKTTHGLIRVVGGSNINIQKPGGPAGTLEVNGGKDIELIEGTQSWSLGGNNPSNGLIISGSRSRIGPNAGGTRELKNGRYLVKETGSGSNPAYHIGANGAGFFVDGNGEVVVVDEAGNQTTIS
jgi:hypothetical protein